MSRRSEPEPEPEPESVPVLEPASRALADADARRLSVRSMSPEESRTVFAGLQRGEGVEKPEVDEEWITADASPYGEVRARVVRPKGVGTPLPVLCYLHGGGWVLGDAHTHDRLVRELAVGVSAAVVFPVYDLAPEAKYPTQLEQGYAVCRWIVEHGAEAVLDPSRVAVCGDGAGGALAAGLALLALERDLELLAQVLVNPVTDSGLDTASYRLFASGPHLGREAMRYFWEQYVGSSDARVSPYAAPLRASLSQLSGLPPALVLTAEVDVLRSEGEAYAARLRAAGVAVTGVRVLGALHDFLVLDSLRDTHGARVGRHLVVSALRNALHREALAGV